MEQSHRKETSFAVNGLSLSRSADDATPSRRAERVPPLGGLHRHAGQRGVNHCLRVRHAINVPSCREMADKAAGLTAQIDDIKELRQKL
jgi:hypothetical protein